MKRHVWIAAMFIGMVLIARPGAQEDVVDQARQRAKSYLATLAKGDPQALKEYYAPQVVVKAHSELLRARWGLNPGGATDKDVEFGRDKLLAGYALLINKAGKRWHDAWARILKDDKIVTITRAPKADTPFPGVHKDDLVVKVRPGPNDDTFLYIFRPDAKEQWRIVIESADY